MTTFVDTNILIKALDEDDELHTWAQEALETRKLQGPAIILDIVFCEFSVAMESVNDARTAIRDLDLERVSCSDEALFRAGKAFRKYRDENKGPKLGVLPDFLIGAMAEASGAPLLTINPKDFKGYFPALELISPT